MSDQLFDNWVCWAILLVALTCYQQLMLQFLQRHATQSENDQQLCTVMISALPLLGLLGTIIGLLQCFAEMSTGIIAGNTLSGGIGDALLTTQLGLVCALPAWLFQAYLRSHKSNHQLTPLKGEITTQNSPMDSQGKAYASAP